jgi:hypothetical protein
VQDYLSSEKKILFGETVDPLRIGKNILNHESIDIDEAVLEKLKEKDRNLLLRKLLREFSPFT